MADETGHLPRGPGRIFKATIWSLQGLRAAWLHESSFRLEVYLLLAMGPLALWLGQTGVERALLLGSCLLVLAMELLNSSIEAVIWVAVGGRGTIVGPIIGALLVNAGKSYFTAALPEYWLFALGALFVVVTLFLPRGIVGLLAARAPRKPTAAVQDTAPPALQPKVEPAE